ncbi:Hsf-type dna-binding protein [Globisporangium polare]
MNLSMLSLHRMEQPVVSPTSSESHNTSSSSSSKEVAPFLKSLRRMLDVESDAILRWTPNGRAFEIHDMEEMMHVVLPKYFKHSKYTSFQRQLNYFNFKKWTKSKAVVCTFSNDFFLRDQPELAWRIARKKSAQLGLKSPTVRRTTSAPTMTMKRIEAANFSGYHESTGTAAAEGDMAIMVPRKAVHRYPHSASIHHYAAIYNTNSHSATHEMDSLDWIDHFLPSLEGHGGQHQQQHPIKSEDSAYLHAMGHLHQHSYLRSAPFVYQSPSDYGRMASM